MRGVLLMAVVSILIGLSAPSLALPLAVAPDNRLTGILLRLSMTRDLATARTELTALAKTNPRYAPGLFDLGVVAEAQRDWAEAERAFELVTRLTKERRYAARAALELVKVRRIKARESAGGPASAQYDEAIGRARAYVTAGFAREAVVESAVAIGIDRRRWEAFAVIGSARSALHDYDGAAQALRKAIELAPERVAPRLELAAELAGKEAQYQFLLKNAGEELRSRKYSAAAHHFLTASQLFPEREMLIYSAAAALYSAKRRSEAQRLLTDLVASGKDPGVVAQALQLIKRVADATAQATWK